MDRPLNASYVCLRVRVRTCLLACLCIQPPIKILSSHEQNPSFRYPILLPVTALYCVIAIGGLVGNALTCMVVAKNTIMRTSTNYYLVNLAVADLFTLMLG